jgi:D-sedoheptulose 7-phosphate isomerase
MNINIVKAAFEEAHQVLTNFMNDEQNYAAVAEAAQQMANCILRGGKIISCGNGGSMSDAMHFAEELSGRFRNDRPSMAAIAISDPTHITCVANDYGFDYIFSRYVEGIGNKGDMLLAISTSGNSANIVNAAQAALDKGMTVVSLTGKSGGKLKGMSQVPLHVEHHRFSDRVQEVHIKIIHILIELIEQLVHEQKSQK